MMKNILRNSSLLLAATLVLASCKKFEETNVNPLAASGNQVQIEYFLNSAITEAQMNPDVAERSFVLYWKTAGHQHSNGGISSG
ncbi:MAG: SusD/RagB family nutrient-binding outer membrane lipoprotein, partial [Pedobacter sp.]